MSKKTHGGCQSFFPTLRPRGGITDDSIRRTIDYTRSMCDFRFIVKEKKLEEGHLHCCLFTKKPYQRSNLISNFITNICIDWDDDSKANLRRWDRSKGTGAFKVLTNLEVITDYLSGTRASKSSDPFEILVNELPDDLSLLEQYMPNVGQLAKPKNQWCHTLHQQLIQHFGFPKTRICSSDITEAYLLSCFKYLENHDIRDITIDKKHLKIRAFLQWWNLDNGPTYAPIHLTALHTFTHDQWDPPHFDQRPT